MGHAVIVAIDHDAVVLADNVDEGSQFGVIGTRRDETVVNLQDLPGRVRLGKGFAKEVNLGLCVLVTLDHIVGVVDRGRLLVFVDEAVGVDHGKGSGPVGALEIVCVEGLVLVTKVPPVINQGSQAGLEIHTGLASHHVVVANGLVPGFAIEGLANVHVGPSLVEAIDPLRVEGHSTVIEVVSDGHESSAVLLQTNFLDVFGSAL